MTYISKNHSPDFSWSSCSGPNSTTTAPQSWIENITANKSIAFLILLFSTSRRKFLEKFWRRRRDQKCLKIRNNPKLHKQIIKEGHRKEDSSDSLRYSNLHSNLSDQMQPFAYLFSWVSGIIVLVIEKERAFNVITSLSFIWDRSQIFFAGFPRYVF